MKKKSNVLILILIIYSMSLPYLTIFTLKYPTFLNYGIDFGTLILSFIPMLLGDLLTECYGSKKAIIYSSVIYSFQLFFILLSSIISIIPGECIGFGDISKEITFSYDILFNAQWRITISSAIGYYFGIVSNSLIMKALKNKSSLFARCIFSTVIGQLLDNGLFFILAMAPIGLDTTSELPWDILLTNILFATGIEILYEIILFPLTNALCRRINRLENE